MKVSGNHEPQQRQDFGAIEMKWLRLVVTATSGSELATVFEARGYA